MNESRWCYNLVCCVLRGSQPFFPSIAFGVSDVDTELLKLSNMGAWVAAVAYENDHELSSELKAPPFGVPAE